MRLPAVIREEVNRSSHSPFQHSHFVLGEGLDARTRISHFADELTACTLDDAITNNFECACAASPKDLRTNVRIVHA